MITENELQNASPERSSLTLPTIEYRSSAEEQNLPFAIDVNPEKLGDFLHSSGFSDERIKKFRLEINYSTPLPAKMAGAVLAIAPLGQVKADGTISIYAKEMVKLIRSEPFNEFLKGIKNGSNLDTKEKMINLSRKIRYFVARQILPESTEVPEEGQLNTPSFHWARKLGIAAKQSDRIGEAIEFLDDYTLRSLKRNFEIAVSHETIHNKQFKGKPLSGYLKAIGIAVPATTLSVLATNVLAAQIYNMASHSDISLVGGAKDLLYNLTTVLGTTVTLVKVPWLAKKYAAGQLEQDAYHEMRGLAEKFADVISVRRTNLPLNN